MSCRWVIPSQTSGLSEQLLPLNEVSFELSECSECSVLVYTALTQVGNSEHSIISNNNEKKMPLILIWMYTVDFPEDSKAVCHGRKKFILQPGK